MIKSYRSCLAVVGVTIFSTTNVMADSHFDSLLGSNNQYEFWREAVKEAFEHGPISDSNLNLWTRDWRLRDGISRSIINAYRVGFDDPESWKSALAGMEEKLPDLGINEQPISPRKAIAQFRRPSLPGSNAWEMRVSERKTERANAGLMTCDAAISQLYHSICDDPDECVIEDAYQQKCDRNSLSEETYKLCYAAEETYSDACMNGLFPNGFKWDQFSSGGTSEEEDVLCNFTYFGYGASADEPFDQTGVVTARHCMEALSEHVEDAYLHLDLEKRQTTNLYQNHGNSLFGGPGELVFVGNDDEGLPDFEEWTILSSARPRLFSPTVFAGQNKLAYHRAEMVRKNERHNHLGNESWYHMIDASPLCTVVAYDSSAGDMRHTCQTSSGSSGGALIQVVAGIPRLVGVHVGFDDGGNNTSNNAVFGYGSEFPELPVEPEE